MILPGSGPEAPLLHPGGRRRGQPAHRPKAPRVGRGRRAALLSRPRLHGPRLQRLADAGGAAAPTQSGSAGLRDAAWSEVGRPRQRKKRL